MLEELRATAVAPWSPRIEISSAVGDKRGVDKFIARISAGFTAPAVEFRPPEALMVMGRHFAVVSEQHGLVPGSIHTIGKFQWHQAFAKVRSVRLLHECPQPPLIAASSGYDNYYHWTAETIGSLLMHRLVSPESGTGAVIPAITRSWQKESLDLFALPNELIEVGTLEAAVFDHAILTNLTARDYAFCPHPQIVRQFRKQLPLNDLPRSYGKLIFVARLDAVHRRHMTNETELCDMLRRHGFEILIPSEMTVRAQASAFAHAALIVAPHGASLANLFYVDQGDDGASVIELQQEEYLSPTYAKLSQVKSLDYSTVISACTDRADYHHHSTWRADIDLIERTVIEKLEHIGAKI